MAKGRDTRNHPNRQVGRANFHDLDERGDIAVNWSSGDRESVPLSDLRHADEDSKLYGRKVSKTHLQEVAKKHNPGNMFSTYDVQVMRDL